MFEQKRQTIMLVDDNQTNLNMGKNLLKDYYEVYALPSAERMFKFLEVVTPDLILLDINMPEMDGYEAIKELKAIRHLAGVPVIFLTANSDEASELKGFSLGAVDYISKPFSPPRLFKRIQNQLLIQRQKQTIRHHAENLTALVEAKTREVFTLQNAIINTVADLVEFRDKLTGGHITRTQMYLKALIQGLIKKERHSGEILQWNMDFILPSAQLHDVGKVAISDQILNKPGKLTPDEFEIIKTHVDIGIDAVNRIRNSTTENAFLNHAAKIVATHHEKWDGTGYPAGIGGENIPLEGRLMAMADVYDALVSWRSYNPNYTHDEAREIIANESGRHFDPTLVEVFFEVEEEFIAITQKYQYNEIDRN